MSLATGLHAFVEAPTALGWPLADMHAAGFRQLVIHALAHEKPVDWHDDAVALRDRARAAGMEAHFWQTMHTGLDVEASAAAALAEAKHWDGYVPNPESILYEDPEAADLLFARVLEGLPPTYPVAASVLPTFPVHVAGMVGAMERLRARGSILCQQAYVKEHGWTASACVDWSVRRSKMVVGWWYWARIVPATGPARTVRVLLESQFGAGAYVIREGRNRWRVDVSGHDTYPNVRRISLLRDPTAERGTLLGFRLGRSVAPTLRTTPFNGAWPTAAECRADLAAAGVTGRGGVYLAETTQDPGDWL